MKPLTIALLGVGLLGAGYFALQGLKSLERISTDTTATISNITAATEDITQRTEAATGAFGQFAQMLVFPIKMIQGALFALGGSIPKVF